MTTSKPNSLIACKPVSLNSFSHRQVAKAQRNSGFQNRGKLKSPFEFPPVLKAFKSVSMSVNPRLKKVLTLPFSLALSWRLIPAFSLRSSAIKLSGYPAIRLLSFPFPPLPRSAS